MREMVQDTYRDRASTGRSVQGEISYLRYCARTADLTVALLAYLLYRCTRHHRTSSLRTHLPHDRQESPLSRKCLKTRPSGAAQSGSQATHILASGCRLVKPLIIICVCKSIYLTDMYRRLSMWHTLVHQKNGKRQAILRFSIHHYGITRYQFFVVSLRTSTPLISAIIFSSSLTFSL